MGIKVARAATIWKFLGDLQRFIISPQKYEVMQLDNNKRIRRNKKATSVVSEAAIRTQEERLTRGEITPMQFLQFMSHKVGLVTPTNCMLLIIFSAIRMKICLYRCPINQPPTAHAAFAWLGPETRCLFHVATLTYVKPAPEF